MKSRWNRGQGSEQHPPVEMRFIDMFMTALGSLVFLALILVFLLPKTTQSKAKDEEIQKLQEEIQQLKKQIPQIQTSQAGGARTEDKEILLRRFGVMLVTNGCTSNHQQPDLYVRTEEKLANFKTNQPTGEAAQFDASNTKNKTILVGQNYFDIGSATDGAFTLESLEKNSLHTKLFFGIARSAGSYSVYASLPNPEFQDAKDCIVYPFYFSSQGVISGENITLTPKRPFAWLRRFRVNVDGTTTLDNSPRADEGFRRDLAEFSEKQSKLLCERKSICNTIDAHYALLVPPPPPLNYARNLSGLTYQAKGELDRALAEFSEAIKLDPKYAEAWFNRGKVYRAKGDLDHAVADYDEAIRLEPSALRLNNRGLAYSDKGDFDRAIADYTEALRLDAKYDPAFYNRGLAYSDKGDFTRAIADYTEAIRLDSKYAPAYSNRGDAYRAKGELDNALSDHNEAIRLEANASRYYNRGLTYLAKGDFDSAIADYTNTIRLDSKNAMAYANRGDAYRAKGDLDRAIADYTEAIRIEPIRANADRFNNRGLAYQAKSDLNRAVADYDAAIRRDPKYVAAYENRAAAYLVKGDLERAIADFSQSISLEANTSRYNSRGFAYVAKGDLDHAMADYSEAIRLDPKLQNSYINRGRAYLLGGSIAKALIDFKQANDLNPNDAYSALWLDLAERRNNISSRLSQYASKLDMKVWPAPIVRLFLGEITRLEVLAAAQDTNVKIARKQICETNFYAGEFALLQSPKTEAERLFRLATEDCSETTIERATANAQLRAIGGKR